MVSWYQTASRIGSQGKSALCIVTDGIDLPPSARRLAGVREYRVGAMDDAEAAELGSALDRAGGLEGHLRRPGSRLSNCSGDTPSL